MIRSIRWSLAGSNGRITTRLLLGFKMMPVRRTFNRTRPHGTWLAVVMVGLESNPVFIVDPFASMEVGS
jgi:hypothetical protein